MYVLPSDRTDERLDLNGVIANSFAAAQHWFSRQTGKRLRLDTYQGILDISFFRLRRTDTEIRSYNAFVRDQIEYELWASGEYHLNKIYAIYYGGSSNWACGGAPWPPELLGNVVALYLKGTPPGATACADNPFASSADTPGYWELSIIHEIFHALGAVGSCAPHHTLRGHVSDDPRDLMYAGPLPWQPSLLDVGRDDYFSHSNSTCLDLAVNAFLDPSSSGGVPPPKWPLVNLGEQHCSQLQAFRSREAKRTTAIEFVNVSSKYVQVYWLNSNGQRQLYANLAPWEIHRQSTFETHPWLVTDATGQCLGIYLPVEQPSRAILGR
jgi:hypothetical protein